MIAAATLVEIDRSTSTVVLAGRRFPAAGLICPVAPDDPDASERSRALGACGAAPGDRSAYVTAENGLLIRVDEQANERYHGLDLDLYARTCELVPAGDELPWWLPWTIGWFGGLLVPGRSNGWRWAEAEWVVEMIDRLSVLPFEEPDGEPARIVRLDYFANDGGDR